MRELDIDVSLRGAIAGGTWSRLSDLYVEERLMPTASLTTASVP